MHLDVYPDGRLLTNLVVEYDADCTPPLALRGPYLELKADVVIRADRTFGVAATLDEERTRVSVSGVFDEHGGLAGTFRVEATRESAGARCECETGVVQFRVGRLLPIGTLGLSTHTLSSHSSSMLSGRGMYRVLILAVALPFLGNPELGRADHDPYDVEIVAIDLAGRRTNLTRNPAWDSSPAVARDGRIVFLSTRDGAADFYVMDGDGRDVRRLTIGQGVWSEDLDFSQASWSPRAARIAFDSQGAPPTPGCLQHCANWDVRVIDADGSGLKQVAVRARAPSWSRDGRRLAYLSGVGAYGEASSVTITRLDGSGSVHVKAFYGFSSVNPVWSPTRDEIAFDARPADASSISIYVVGADGRRKRRLAVGHDPAWSRDGSRLAFIDDYTLFTIGRNGTGRRRVSRKGEFVIGAAWSPRGGTLGFVAGTTAPRFGGMPRNLRVETVSADGKRVRVLARVGWVVWDAPVWTPDGKRMLVAVEAH